MGWVPEMFAVCPCEAKTRHQAAELTDSVRGLGANLNEGGVWMRSARLWLCKYFIPGFQSKLGEQGSKSTEMISNGQNVQNHTFLNSPDQPSV